GTAGVRRTAAPAASRPNAAPGRSTPAARTPAPRFRDVAGGRASDRRRWRPPSPPPGSPPRSRGRLPAVPAHLADRLGELKQSRHLRLLELRHGPVGGGRVGILREQPVHVLQRPLDARRHGARRAGVGGRLGALRLGWPATGDRSASGRVMLASLTTPVDSETSAPKPLLLFVHIPKTAGTTLRTVLSMNEPGARSRAVGNVFKGGGGISRTVVPRLRQGNLPDLTRIRLIRGHVPLGVRDLYAPHLAEGR